jgi:hypothetical protein
MISILSDIIEKIKEGFWNRFESAKLQLQYFLLATVKSISPISMI